MPLTKDSIIQDLLETLSNIGEMNNMEIKDISFLFLKKDTTNSNLNAANLQDVGRSRCVQPHP